MPYLVHHFNGTPISHYELTETLTIGRGEGNDLRIDDVTISAKHAVVTKTDDGGYDIIDQGSTNGVLYAGKKVDRYRFKEGDFILLGTHDLQFVTELPEPLVQTAKIKKSWIPGVYYTAE